MLLLGGDMNEQANPVADTATDHPASKSTSHPRKKKKRNTATWIALASAATAVVAASISAFQVSVTRQQNIVSEQQQLVALTAAMAQTLAQEQTAITQAEGNLTGVARTEAASNVETGTVALLEVDGEAAAVLISELHGFGVAGIEYVQVARALDAAGHTAQAITFYDDAISAPPHDVVTIGLALRNQGALYYSIGQNAAGHRDFLKAVSLYRGHVLMTSYLRDNTIAQAYLADAENQLSNNGCRVAAADMLAAFRALHPLGSGGMSFPNQTLTADDTTAFKLKCARTA
jgi:tetratricopeptide (TPR) repeat protein